MKVKVLIVSALACAALAQDNPLAALIAKGPIPAAGKRAFVAHVGAVVLEADTGKLLFESRAEEFFTPASNMKLLTTSAALYALGPKFRFETRLLAAGSGDTLGRVTLVGSGDPTFAQTGQNSLEALAKAVAAKGVKTINELRLDDTAFNWPRWGNGWMWDDTEYPIGALFLDGDGSPYGEMVKEDDALAKGEKPNPTLITDPDVYPLEVGKLFVKALEAAGVKVGALKRAKAEAGDALLASTTSGPLAQIVRDTNKWSINIYAEQLYARLGLGTDGKPSTPGSSSAALMAFLKTAGLDTDSLRIRDASGLTRYDLVSPRQVAQLLSYVYQHPLAADGSQVAPSAWNTANAFIVSLPKAGTGEATDAAKNDGGTLRNRLIDSKLEVWAKTGSMTGVSSLSGYVLAKSGKLLIFSLLMDNYPGAGGDLRNLQDELVKAMAAMY